MRDEDCTTADSCPAGSGPLQFSRDPNLYPPPLIPTGHLLPSVQAPGPVSCCAEAGRGSFPAPRAWGAAGPPGRTYKGLAQEWGPARSGCLVKRTVGWKSRLLVNSLGPFFPPHTPLALSLSPEPPVSLAG